MSQRESGGENPTEQLSGMKARETPELESSDRVKEILAMGGWSTMGGETQSPEYIERFRGKFCGMNGTLTFSDGEHTWFTRWEAEREQAVREAGFESDTSMFAPPLETFYNR